MEYQGRKIRGLCHKDDKVIEVSRKQTPRMILSTFWHELLHAIEHEHRITMKHSLIHELEEPLADVLPEESPDAAPGQALAAAQGFLAWDLHRLAIGCVGDHVDAARADVDLSQVLRRDHLGLDVSAPDEDPATFDERGAHFTVKRLLNGQ